MGSMMTTEKTMRENHTRLLEMVDEGLVDPMYALQAALGWMEDRDIAEMMRANDILDPEEEEEEDEE
jgi:hypothetical protein